MPHPRNFLQGFLQLGVAPQQPDKPKDPEKPPPEIPPRPIFEPQKGVLILQPQDDLFLQHGTDLADVDFHALSGQTIHAALEATTIDAVMLDQLQNFSNMALEADVTIIVDLTEPNQSE